MNEPDVFIDTNILLYLLSSDSNKADRAEAVLGSGGQISVQVLNEMTNVLRRKLSMSWTEIDEIISLTRSMCPVDALTIETHEKGRAIAERYKLGVYDSMIVAAALISGCTVLYSEDMQDGIFIDGCLRVLNPFFS